LYQGVRVENKDVEVGFTKICR